MRGAERLCAAALPRRHFADAWGSILHLQNNELHLQKIPACCRLFIALDARNIPFSRRFAHLFACHLRHSGVRIARLYLQPGGESIGTLPANAADKRFRTNEIHKDSHRERPFADTD